MSLFGRKKQSVDDLCVVLSRYENFYMVFRHVSNEEIIFSYKTIPAENHIRLEIVDQMPMAANDIPFLNRYMLHRFNLCKGEFLPGVRPEIDTYHRERTISYDIPLDMSVRPKYRFDVTKYIINFMKDHVGNCECTIICRRNNWDRHVFKLDPLGPPNF